MTNMVTRRFQDPMDPLESRCVGEIRRVTDQQASAITGHMEELRHQVRMAVAIIAGALAGAGLIGQAGWRVVPVLGLFAVAGILFVFVAAMEATRVVAGLGTPVEVPRGPDTETLLGAVGHWTEAELDLALAHAGAAQSRALAQREAALADAVGRVAVMLLAGAGLGAGALTLIVWRAII